MLYRFGKNFFNDMLAEYDITSAQLMILLEIQQHPNINQDQVADITGFDKGTVARCAAVLETKGLVERIIDPANRRAYKLRITNKFLSVQKKLDQSVEQYSNVLFNGMSDDLCQQTNQCLDAMASNARIYQPDHIA